MSVALSEGGGSSLATGAMVAAIALLAAGGLGLLLRRSGRGAATP